MESEPANWLRFSFWFLFKPAPGPWGGILSALWRNSTGPVRGTTSGSPQTFKPAFQMIVFFCADPRMSSAPLLACFCVFSPTAESFGGFSPDRLRRGPGGPEVRFHYGCTRVPPGFQQGSTRFCEGRMLLGISPEFFFCTYVYSFCFVLFILSRGRLPFWLVYMLQILMSF